MDLLVGGLSIGAVYALVAIGIVLIYRATSIVNFAQGELMMASAYCALFVGETTGSSGLQLFAALGAGALGGLTCFVLTNILLRGSDHMTLVIGTLGLLILLQTSARYLFTDIPMRAEGWLFGDHNVAILGTSVPANSILLLGSAVVVSGALLAWQNGTTYGRAVLAAAEDPWRAALSGIHVRTTLATSWAFGGALAGFAGLLLGPVVGVFPTMGADVIFPAFIAAILGGFHSISGALIGGLLLGLIQTYAVVYLGGAWKEVASFAALLAILLWRPTGLLRAATARRV
jgi:branched-chain amino acid transport system permease protein